MILQKDIQMANKQTKDRRHKYYLRRLNIITNQGNK